MSLFRARENLAIALMPLMWSAPGRALPPDPDLLALIPPGTQILAGIIPTPPGRWHRRFLLITRKCALDMEDFGSLSGMDPSRDIHQVLFVAQQGVPPTVEEHGILVSGRFDQARIYRSALDGGARNAEYRGIHVVEIQPFARERGVDQIRWLAILQSNVLLFGTVETVKEALDQKFAPGAQDSRLVQNLAALRRDDDAWSIVVGTRNSGIRGALAALSPELAAMADGKVLRLGIRYGRQIEFEYAVDSSSQSGKPHSDSAWSLPGRSAHGSFSLLPRLKFDGTREGGAHGTFKVSPERYDRWIDEVSHGENQQRLSTP